MGQCESVEAATKDKYSGDPKPIDRPILPFIIVHCQNHEGHGVYKVVPYTNIPNFEVRGRDLILDSMGAKSPKHDG